MYLQNSMHRLLDSFKLGFTSDRIVSVLGKLEKENNVTENDKAVVEEGVGIIDLILQGKEQIETGQYGSNALESLKLYNKSVSVVLDMPETGGEISAKRIKEIFYKLKRELSKIADGKGTKKEIENVKFFFDCLRTNTLDDSTTIMNDLNEPRSSHKWELALEM
jgi:hypothetical protein